MDQKGLILPVEMLCHGLYVAELDRPWLGTPFVFQGFTIQTDEDLEQLQEYCRTVRIDPARSDATAVAQARRKAGSGSGEESDGADPHGRHGMSERDRIHAFGRKAFPDRARFREMVKVAHDARLEARSAVDSAMDDVRLGHAVDVPSLRNAVGKMTQAVIGNASAALWLTALKNVSEYTAIHCINVCVVALAFGRHLGLPPRQLRGIGLGALLHDVGKARTPKEILDKTGPLTDEEYEIIKRHPEEGYQMVAEAGNVVPSALDIIRLHHERMSGKGYPFGLAAEEIPQHVRMVSIVDCYDAMTSRRSYSSARSPDTALKVLYEERGSDFDESLVSQFIRCIGIFPVGSVVQLDTGALGLVVASSANAHLRPTILMLRTPDGEPYKKRLLINLAAEDEDLTPYGRRIARGVEPESTGIDIPSIVSEEFGLEAL